MVTYLSICMAGPGCISRPTNRRGRKARMKTQTIQVLLVALSGTGVWAQSHPGAPYGARDPAVCKSTKDPVNGAPTVEQAKAYVLCGVSGEKEAGGYLYLISELKIEVAASSRPYNSWTDSTPDIDPHQPVYNIRGSYVSYQCTHPSQGGGFGLPAGQNCIRYDAGSNAPLRATGFCYKDSFADWHCKIKPIDVERPMKTGQPAPRQ
jgi:hypothetical protein